MNNNNNKKEVYDEAYVTEFYLVRRFRFITSFSVALEASATAYIINFVLMGK
jgi:hypothetical protein